MAAPTKSRDEFGGVAVLDTDDFGGVAVAARSERDEFGGVPVAPKPTSNQAADFARRIPEGMATGTGRTIQGLARAADIAQDAPPIPFMGGFGMERAAQTQIKVNQEIAAANRVRSATRQQRMEESPTYQFGAGTVEAAQGFYGVDRARDDEFVGQLATAAGEMVPTLVTGAFTGPIGAGVQYAASAGESQAQEAIAAGREDVADIAFLSAAGLGGLTEAALGVPGRLLSIINQARKAGVNPGKFGQWANRNPVKSGILRVGAEGGAREAGQEGLEQAGGNLIASDLAGYDPDRPVGQGVGRAMALGGVLGGVIGGGAAGVNQVNRNQQAAQLRTARTVRLTADGPEYVVNPETGTTEFAPLENDWLPAPVPQTQDPIPQTPSSPATPPTTAAPAATAEAATPGLSRTVMETPDPSAYPDPLEGQSFDTRLENRPEAAMETRPTAEMGAKGAGAGSDILGIISDARDTQARFLKERGTTIEEARNLPKTKQAKLQSDYEAWLKTEGGFMIPPQSGDPAGWKRTQDWRKAVDQVPDIEDKLDWLRAVANNGGSKAAALDLSDALDKVESLRREWPEHSRIGNALWDIAQNPAASAETKARAMAAREDLLSQGGKFPDIKPAALTPAEVSEFNALEQQRRAGALDGPREPAVDPDLAETIAALRAGYRPEVEKPTTPAAETVAQGKPASQATVERAMEIEKSFGLEPADAHFFNVAIEAVKANPGKWTTLAEGIQKEAMRAATLAKGSYAKTGDLKLSKQIADKYLSPAAETVAKGKPVEQMDNAELTSASASPMPAVVATLLDVSPDPVAAKLADIKADEADKFIEDFGEKIVGARKDLWATFKKRASEALPADSADISISSAFPEPDYEEAMRQGVPMESLATFKALRDMVPAKPRQSWKLERWVELVRGLHALTSQLVQGRLDITPERLAEMVNNRAFGRIAQRVRLYRTLGYPAFTQAKDWSTVTGSYSVYRSQKFNPPKTITSAEHKGRSTDLEAEGSGPEAEAQVAELIRRKIAEAASQPKADDKVEFKLFKDRLTGDIFIGKKAVNGVVRLKTGFKSVKEARQFIADQQAELETQWAGLKAHPEYRRAINLPRQGPVRREGDVSPQLFQDAFGFRGVQFGNWVESDRRQVDLNEAFDALMDMAQALGVPPKALSLDGSLGLAFGARGTAGAKAHYEPGEVVINITKKSGPGSLAHEWFHAVDNYFARLDRTGKTEAKSLDAFATSNLRPAVNLRPEVAAAFKRVREVLGMGTFAARSGKLDEARSKAYYGTTIEKAARAFEQYVVDRLALGGISNDYLVNLVKDESPALPTDREMEGGIRQAFDGLFEAIEVAPESGSVDVIDAKLTEYIERLKLSPGALYEGVTGAPVWLTKAALRGVVQVVRVAYRASKDLALALRAGLEWLRDQNLRGFDEAQAHGWLAKTITEGSSVDGLNIRATSDLLAASPLIPDEVREMIANVTYEVVTDKNATDFANRILDALGDPSAALPILADASNGFGGKRRTVLAFLTLLRLSQAITQAKAAGDTATVQRLAQTEAAVYDYTLADRITDAAQTLQAVSVFSKLSPEGRLIHARRRIQRAGDRDLDPLKAQLNDALEKLEKAKKELADETARGREIQEQAAKAIADALEAEALQPGTPVGKAIAIHVLGQLRQAGIITAVEAEVMRQHYAATDPSLTLAQKLERANIPQPEKRAKQIESERTKAIEAERARLKKRVAALGANPNIDALSLDAVDAALLAGMRQLKLNLGKLVREHWSKVERTGQTLAESLVTEGGLIGEAAQKLAAAFERRFNQLAQAKLKRELEQVLKPVTRSAIAKPGLVDKLMGLLRLGAFSNEAYWKAVMERLKLPEFSEALRDRLTAIGARLDALPEADIEGRHRVSVEFLNALEQAAGIDPLDLSLGFYVTNLLTGIPTHVANTSANFFAAIANAGIQMELAIAEGRYDDIPAAIEAAAVGLKKALPQAGQVMRTGILPAVRQGQARALRPMELAQFGTRGGVPLRDTGMVSRSAKWALESYPAKILNLWKLNGRAMAAEDLLAFTPAMEVQRVLLARRVARAEGLRGEALRNRVAGLLADSDPANEEDAREFALRVVNSATPYGLVGAVVNLINQAKSSEHRALRGAANIVAPVLTIPMNAFNESLNYTPVGLWRRRSSVTNLLGRDVKNLSLEQQQDLRAELLAKALTGTLFLTAAALMFAQFLDDDDPALALYGTGPQDMTDNKGWRERGALPHSLKVGNTYFSFALTPIAAPLSALGNWFDRERDVRIYGKKRSDSLGTQAGVALLSSLDVLFEQPFMVGFVDLFRLAGNTQGSDETKVRSGFRRAAKTASSFVVPNEVRNIDRYFDPKVYPVRDLEGALISSVPFVRGMGGKPALNALGQPIESQPFHRFLSQQASDPLIRGLDAKGAWPTVLDDRNKVWPAKRRAMTEGEFYSYQAETGKALDRKLRAEWPAWSRLPDAIARDKVNEAATKERAIWRSRNGWGKQ